MRNAFIQELVVLAREHPHIALIVGDLGFSVIEPFADEFPERFVNVGVAEQNMMGLAAGMASEGYHVFTYSIANFPTFRCAEQIRNDIDYHQLPVTIVAVGGGVAYGNLGYSHHAVQDYALMRIMPNLLIAAPGDPLEVRACLRYLVANPQPSYLRLGKAGEPCFHQEIPELSPGKWVSVPNQQVESNTAFLITGATLEIGYYQSQKQKAKLYSLPLWGMKYKAIQNSYVKKFNLVITLEDHLQDGGFGSWLLESCCSDSNLLSKIEVKALNSSVCGMVANQKTLNRIGGLFYNDFF